MKASASDGSAPVARMSRSPLVSAPRRTLPTVAISAPGACSCRYATSASAISVARDSRWRPANRCRSSIAWRISCSFLRAHALEAADAAGLRRRGEIVEALDAQLAVEHGHRLRPDALQAQHVEQRGGKFRQQLLADRAIAGASRSRECGRRGPCRCRSSRAGRPHRARTTASAAWATTSAALR